MKKDGESTALAGTDDVTVIISWDSTALEFLPWKRPQSTRTEWGPLVFGPRSLLATFLVPIPIN